MNKFTNSSNPDGSDLSNCDSSDVSGSTVPVPPSDQTDRSDLACYWSYKPATARKLYAAPHPRSDSPYKNVMITLDLKRISLRVNK